jgi:hypothetical protein
MDVQGSSGRLTPTALPALPRRGAETPPREVRNVEIIEGFARTNAGSPGACGFLAQLLAQELTGQGLDFPRRHDAELAYGPRPSSGTALLIEA